MQRKNHLRVGIIEKKGERDKGKETIHVDNTKWVNIYKKAKGTRIANRVGEGKKNGPRKQKKSDKKYVQVK
jgi:hypothetical protein